MEFFDLNIPYSTAETTKKASSTTRLHLAAKAMELGYGGVAYNHTIKGVMSQSHRCSIPLFSLSSFQKLSPPHLSSSSAIFHRQLLNVAVSSPFRQYTRLTVIVDSPSQAAALNTGNPVLKTYDLVAVCPVNQNAFEHACQNAQVDIISIDFSDKLPFRLKQTMVKAAIERGVYFEITYSNLVLDAQVRRQIISNAKLLVDWTRGKNLIFSSGAPSLTELRGPYDVANLSSLLGLSFERAKAAISKSCRSVIANALRKKHYYKEAIKVEILPAGGQINYNDWLNWDPISSGEGDLILDDLEKSFSTSDHVSKTAKAIDFTSALNGLPSHGLQIMDMIPIEKAAPKPSAVGENSSTPQELVVTCSVCEISEQPGSFSFPSKDQTSLQNVQTIDLTFGNRKSEISSSLTCTLNNSIDVAEKGNHAVVNEELKSSQQVDHTEKDPHDLNLRNCIANSERKIISTDNKSAETCIQETQIAPSGDLCAPAETSTPLKDFAYTPSHSEGSRMLNTFSAGSYTHSVTVDEVLAERDSRTIKELATASCDVSLHEGFLERENLMEAEDSPVMIVDQFPVKKCDDQTTAENKYSVPREPPSASCDMSMHEGCVEREKIIEERDGSVVNCDESPVGESYDKIKSENEYLVMKDEPMEEDNVGNQTLIEDHAGRSHKFLGESPSGRGRVKRRASRRISLLPFKHLLLPRPFKKKARKLNHL